MSAKKTERLLNLVICLLATRRFLTVHQIRELVPGYARGASPDSDEAFRRMFERDKEELRELGVPLETGTDARAHDDEPGYRIARRDYELPEIVLEADEAAALGLAARLWQSAPLAGATASALLKLQASGIDVTPVSGALEPRVAAAEPAFGAALQAVRDRRRVRFSYRTAGRREAEERSVEPWGVVSWHGRWYLVGHDTARGATRVFRLSRVQGDLVGHGPPGDVVVPDGVDLRALVARAAGEQGTTPARLRVRRGAGWALRAEAVRIESGGEWDVLETTFSDPERLADRVAGFGADVVVLAPAEARDAVVRRLTAAAAAHAEPGRAPGQRPGAA